MKSNPSFFNITAFRKNITRFAPAWVLYTVCLLMGMLMMADSGTDFWFVADMATCIQAMAVVNLVYAVIVAMLLFGDLYNTRMCYTLHAMPLRREGWFLTNLLSGLFFSVVPTVIMAIPSLLLSLLAVNVTGSWQVPLWWFLGTNLSYLYFFGLAVLCIFCVGNRFAALLVYGIANALPWVLYSLIDTLYTPMLYGVATWEDPFLFLSPMVMLSSAEHLEVIRTYLDTERTTWIAHIALGDWRYITGCAILGVVLMGLALLLYRRRKLESAGEFISLKGLKPVFLVLYTLCAGIAFYFGTELFVGVSGLQYIFLVIGILVGWFTGSMLLKRTVRVFNRRAFAGCGVLVAALLLSLGLNALDPFGIARWVPEPDEVEAVTLNASHYASRYTPGAVGGDGSEIVLEGEGNIRRVIKLQQLDMEHHRTHGIDCGPHYSYTINYHMTDGTTISRYYEWDGKPGEMYSILNPWFSSIECLFGMTEDAFLALYDDINGVNLNGVDLEDTLTEQDLAELLTALAADCAEGNMAQRSYFHNFHPNCGQYNPFDLCLDFRTSALPSQHQGVAVMESTVSADSVYAPPSTVSQRFYLNIRECGQHTLQWIEDHGLMQYRYEDSKG